VNFDSSIYNDALRSAVVWVMQIFPSCLLCGGEYCNQIWLFLGGTSESVPFIRAEYLTKYYGALIWMKRGCTLCVACQLAEGKER
jgi:hypothetical protein